MTITPCFVLALKGQQSSVVCYSVSVEYGVPRKIASILSISTQVKKRFKNEFMVKQNVIF